MSSVVTSVTIVSGQPVLTSGEYEMCERDGRSTVVRLYLTQGNPAPPTAKSGQYFKLIRAIERGYTSTASAAVIRSSTEDYSEVLKRLAKK